MRFLRPLRFYVCGIGCPCQGVAPPRFDVLGVRHPSQGIVSPSALMCWGLSHPTMELHVSFYCRLRALDTLKECHFSLTSTSWGVRCPRKGIASRSSLTSWGSDTPEGCQVSLYFDVLRGQIPFQGGRAPWLVGKGELGASVTSAFARVPTRAAHAVHCARRSMWRGSVGATLFVWVSETVTPTNEGCYRISCYDLPHRHTYEGHLKSNLRCAPIWLSKEEGCNGADKWVFFKLAYRERWAVLTSGQILPLGAL